MATILTPKKKTVITMEEIIAYTKKEANRVVAHHFSIVVD